MRSTAILMQSRCWTTTRTATTANRRKRTINPLPVQPARPRPIKHQPAVRDRRAAGSPRVHRFKDSLALSERFVDADWWEPLYKRAFPTLASAVAVREDGWAQRGGIDRLLTLSCGRTYTVDEKVRMHDWPDVLLERWSDEQRRIPGWIQKPLAADFIAYAFVPAGMCLLLPVVPLQRAWRQHGRRWIALYGTRTAQNPGYVSVGVPVPRPVLMQAIVEAMFVS